MYNTINFNLAYYCYVQKKTLDDFSESLCFA